MISRWQLLGMGYHIQWHSWQARTEKTSEDKRPVPSQGHSSDTPPGESDHLNRDN